MSRPKNNPVLWLLPEIADEWPAELKNAIADRNQANVTGCCPCGAVIQVREVAPKVFTGSFQHEDDCGAWRVDEIATKYGVHL